MAIAKKHPKFVRTNYGRTKRKRVGRAWRFPRGQDNKQKKRWKYMSRLPSIGYGSAKATRGLKDGMEETLVHNVSELEKGKLARIAGGVGGRKRALIIAEAKKLGIRVLNPGSKQT